MNKKLTNKQKIFVAEYLIDFHGARAAVAAGYAKDSARQQAVTTLSLHYIKDYVNKEMHKRIDAAGIDAEWVLKELYECWNADPADIIDCETGDLKPIHEWPLIWRKMSTGIKVKRMQTQDGTEGSILEVIMSKKDKFLELLGKHVNVKAFQENVVIDINVNDMSAKLSAARKRMNQEIVSEN